MIRLGIVGAVALVVAGCNVAGDTDLNVRAYTTCLDQSLGQPARARGARQVALQRAFETCRAQEQALLAASTAQIGADGASKALADGKAAYSRRIVAAGR